jgi:hypothetical protein
VHTIAAAFAPKPVLKNTELACVSRPDHQDAAGRTLCSIWIIQMSSRPSLLVLKRRGKLNRTIASSPKDPCDEVEKDRHPNGY